MTPHNNAKKEDIANIVIMPGDPKRVEFIKDNYLDNPVLVNDVRYALCYTGTYKGKKVSVMASGMGMPSMSIYAYELFEFYDVETIIRVGSCQSRDKTIDLSDLILATSSYTDSNISKSYSNEDINISYPSKDINNKILETAKKINQNINQGQIWTSDLFYKDFELDNEYTKNSIGLEMETFALFYLANKLNKKAASILTVSDSAFNSKVLTPEEREKTFKNAINLALESII